MASPPPSLPALAAPPPSSLPSSASKEDTTAAAAADAEKRSALFRMPISLQPANSKNKNNNKPNRFFKRFRSVFRSFPIIVPSCKMPVAGNNPNDSYINGGKRITGTLFGHRKAARINLAFQENPRCLPFLVLELGIPTGKVLQDMGVGLNRIALECERHSGNEKVQIIDEPIWTLFCNGKKTGYAVKREPTEDDLNVMQMLHAVSMAVGVLPNEMSDPHDGELSYMRASFERVVGSKDSETFYMMMPDGSNNGPELTVFFVRL